MKAFYPKQFPVYLVVALLALSVLSGGAEAMFMPAAPRAGPVPFSDRAADLAKIQKALESKALAQRLIDYGLSPENALDKINGLSDWQVHQFAANINAFQAGGMRANDLMIILLLILLIVILI